MYFIDPGRPRVAGDESGEFRTPATDSLRTAVLGVVNILKSKGRKEAIEHLWNSNNPLANSVRSSATRKRLLTMGGEYSWWRYLHPTKKEYAYPMAIKNLGTIKIPTLIVTADHDIEKCREVAQILVKGIPGAKLISIKGAGHIMNMDKPKEFNRSITEFIVRSINK